MSQQRLIRVLVILLISISVYYQFVILYQSMTESEAMSNDIHDFVVTPSNITSQRRQSSIDISTRTVDSSYPPQSIGPCHNLSWEKTTSAIPKPIWVASFPGSGAEMFRQLIEVVSGGIPAWSIYIKDNPIPNTTCLQANAATCKTHWPVLTFQPLPFNNQYHPQAIVLLRNPITAFPSRFNHQWELQHKVGYHVKQAPEKAWKSWIQRSFHQQQDKFIEFVTTWSNLSSPNKMKDNNNNNNNGGNVALFVPYEGLIDPKQGPIWTGKIIKVLHQAGMQHIVVEDIKQKDGSEDVVDCLWRDTILDRPQRKRAPHTYQPGYTPKQLQFFHNLFQTIFANIHDVAGIEANNDYDDDDESRTPRSDLISILEMYQQSVNDNESIRIVP